MTQDELKRAEEGFRIQSDINAYHNKVVDLTEEREQIGTCCAGRQVSVHNNYIDHDLVIAAFTEQIERYKLKIAELQKEFDEL